MNERSITNSEVAQILSEIADYLKIDNVAFKPQAYERASEAILRISKPIKDIYTSGGIKALKNIPGVGASIAEKLEELIKTGHIKYHEGLKKKLPVNLKELELVDGVGIKSIKVLYDELGITNIAELERAAKKKKIRELEGFGKKKEDKILESIAFHKSRGNRFLLHDASREAREVKEELLKLPEVQDVIVAGSIRRGLETIGDIDILVLADNGRAVGEAAVGLLGVEHVYGVGETKTMVRLKSGIDLDVRVVPMESWGAALNYFTGSRDHNVALRKRALAKRWKLNEYGLFLGKQRVAGKNEEELYGKLGLSYIEPELREAQGEIKLSEKLYKANKKMPKLVEYKNLKGDLQTQSDWTDGRDSILALAREAMRRGLSYIAITDHTKRLAMTGGLDAKRLRLQMGEIDKLNAKLSGITILKGTECDILKDGSLDLPDDVLAQLDVVGVSVHSFFNFSRAEQTERIVRAIENPNVDIFFHPTGRIVGKRDSYAVDMDAVIKAAKDTGTVLEVNGSSRLDMNGELTKRAISGGAKIAINSDAHRIEHFDFLEYGIMQARRGGAVKRDVVNTLSLALLRSALKKS